MFYNHNINNINNSSLKIYDEDNSDLTINDIKENDTLISIIQVSDIKFTSKNFQIDYLVKQIMQVNEKNIINDKLINVEKQEDIVTEVPVIEKPLQKSTVTEEPVTEEPVTEEPVTQEPVTEVPVTQEPVTEVQLQKILYLIPLK